MHTWGSFKIKLTFSHLSFRPSLAAAQSRSPQNSLLFLRLCSIVATKLDLNLGANSANLLAKSYWAVCPDFQSQVGYAIIFYTRQQISSWTICKCWNLLGKTYIFFPDGFSKIIDSLILNINFVVLYKRILDPNSVYDLPVLEILGQKALSPRRQGQL